MLVLLVAILSGRQAARPEAVHKDSMAQASPLLPAKEGPLALRFESALALNHSAAALLTQASGSHRGSRAPTWHHRGLPSFSPHALHLVDRNSSRSSLPGVPRQPTSAMVMSQGTNVHHGSVILAGLGSAVTAFGGFGPTAILIALALVFFVFLSMAIFQNFREDPEDVEARVRVQERLLASSRNNQPTRPPAHSPGTPTGRDRVQGQQNLLPPQPQPQPPPPPPQPQPQPPQQVMPFAAWDAPITMASTASLPRAEVGQLTPPVFCPPGQSRLGALPAGVGAVQTTSTVITTTVPQVGSHQPYVVGGMGPQMPQGGGQFGGAIDFRPRF